MKQIRLLQNGTEQAERPLVCEAIISISMFLLQTDVIEAQEGFSKTFKDSRLDLRMSHSLSFQMCSRRR